MQAGFEESPLVFAEKRGRSRPKQRKDFASFEKTKKTKKIRKNLKKGIDKAERK
jgi:hypothetical protein